MEVFVLSLEYNIARDRIDVFGITQHGETVNLMVRDFTHHCLVKKRDAKPIAPNTPRPLVQPKICEIQSRIDGYGYHEVEDFLYLADPSLHIIRAWVDYYKAAWKEEKSDSTCKVYNSSLSPIAQFMMETGFHGGGWIAVQNERRLHDGESVYEVNMRDMKNMEGNTKYPPSLRIASFDIETVKGRTCQIATAFYVLDEKLGLVSRRIVAQTLRRANPIKDAEVRYYGRNRKRMYEEWVAMMREFQPHILTGYNIKNFDIPTVLGDAAACGLSAQECSFAAKDGLSLVRPPMTAKCRAQGGSKQAGVRKQTDVFISGVVVMDVYEAVLCNDKKHKSNKLKYVAQALLGYTKLDVDYADIPRYLADTKEGWVEKMTEMLDYNRVDATLPFDIAEKQKNWGDMIAMSRVAGGQLEWVYGRGQTCKAVALIARQMFLSNFVMPDMRPSKEEMEKAKANKKTRKQEEEDRYEGAVVLDPVPGIYDYLKDEKGAYLLDEEGQPIPAFVTTVDFASLYPSIIRAFNFCFTTVLLDGIAPDGVPTYLSEFKALFVKKEHRRGILPRILDVLTDNRASVRALQKPLVAKETKALYATVKGTPEFAAAKAALDEAMETPEYAALECMQLAIKRVSNSLYGATGSPNFFMPCVQIAASVTAEGRKNIKEKTKPYIEAKYPGCIIVYGDTDSIMVALKLKTMEATMEAGRQLAKDITAFINCPPIKLEWEKVLWPAVFSVHKKNYYGAYWTNSTEYDKLYVRGLAFIKSSTCIFMRDACTQVCEMIACKMRPIPEVLAYIKEKRAELQTIAKDRTNVKLLDALLLYMKNGKESYDIVNGITELIRKNNARGNAPIELGERVPFFVIKTAENEMAYRVEHEDYVRKHPAIEIDVQYYVDKQWRNTLHNLMPGYEKEVDEALLPPSQKDVRAYTETISAPTMSAFEAFALRKEEFERMHPLPPVKPKRKRAREVVVVVNETPKKPRTTPPPTTKRSREEKHVSEPVKKTKLITEFFTKKE